MEQTAPLDFPFPNEIIEIVTAYLTTEDLIALAAVVTKRLNKCILRVLRKRLRGKYKSMAMLKLISLNYIHI